MSYYAVRRWGDSVDTPNEQLMREILDELDVVDCEHIEVSLSNDNGWCLSVYGSGLVVWENIENLSFAPRHLLGVSKEDALRLWILLSRNDLEIIENQNWHDGTCPPISDAERAALVLESEKATMASFRLFYDSLGHERAEKPCRSPGCTRGSVIFSVLCRPHHFESLYKNPCPFNH